MMQQPVPTPGATVEMRFYEELNDFLPPERRRRAFTVALNTPRSVKDLVEAQQVPHTEVDLILVDGVSVGFDHPVRGGERVAVYPAFESLNVRTASRLGRPPLREIRFIADVHLGTLARRLRLLGFDCAYEPPWDDAKLAQRSADERRILLTRDRRLLMRAIVSHGICLHSDKPDQQLRELVQRLDLAGEVKPMSRCGACNGLIEGVEANSVRHLIPPRTWHYTQTYYRCTGCGKLYWKGTHWPRLERILRSVVGEAALPPALPGAESPPP
jgi:uncharacterized protein